MDRIYYNNIFMIISLYLDGMIYGYISGPCRWLSVFNRVISAISVVQRETTLTTSDSTGEPVSM